MNACCVLLKALVSNLIIILNLVSVPGYHSRHIVQDAPWSYCPPHSPQKQLQEIEAVNSAVRTIDLSIPPPPYILCEVRSAFNIHYIVKNVAEHNVE